LIAEIIVFGAIQGAVYALIAIGFSLVYGVGGILNLAHGAFYLIAAYSALWLIPYVGLPLGFVLAVAITTLLGAAAYLLLIKPMQKSHIGVVILTFALAFLMEQFVRIFEVARTGVSTPVYLTEMVSGSITFLGVIIQTQLILAFFGSIILVLLVTLFINKARIGKSIRAVSQDREAATLMGINANRILMLTVVLSAFLAAFASVLYTSGSATFSYMGWSTLLIAFAVVVLGGMGSIPGSVLGAFVIAYARNICTYLIDPSLAELVPLVVILLVLVIRPQGLLGKKEIR
jgi:branched-chain amino acid transport system permease protein